MHSDKEVQVLVRMPAALAEWLDEYRRTASDLPSRPEAIRRILDAARKEMSEPTP